MSKVNDIFKEIGHALISKKFWVELLIMTLGMFMTAICVYYFLVPSKLIVGSISGLSIVLTNIFNGIGVNISLSWMITIINAILLILAYILIGKEFGLKTVYCALILGPLTKVCEWIYPWENFKTPNGYLVNMGVPVDEAYSVMGNPWFDLLCCVVILSAAQTMMFSINASTGGLDILAKIVNKYLHFDMGKSVSVAGAIICLTAFAINPFQMVVIGLIATWINGMVVNMFTANLNQRKRVCIVSKDYDRIRRYIIDDLDRGCTLYEVIGGYTNEKSIELEALLTNDEFSKLMEFLGKNEINAFTTAGNVSEVYGLWAKDRRRTRKHADKR
ncbi:MAG: YitT family protein [Bacteroidales bacterium]|nr:YitT family protein [Bacteroidales bacterium]